MIPPPPRSTLFPYTTLFRSFIVSELGNASFILWALLPIAAFAALIGILCYAVSMVLHQPAMFGVRVDGTSRLLAPYGTFPEDRKSTRLNSSHLGISYAVFCL